MSDTPLTHALGATLADKDESMPVAYAEMAKLAMRLERKNTDLRNALTAAINEIEGVYSLDHPVLARLRSAL